MGRLGWVGKEREKKMNMANRLTEWVADDANHNVILEGTVQDWKANGYDVPVRDTETLQTLYNSDEQYLKEVSIFQ